MTIEEKLTDVISELNRADQHRFWGFMLLRMTPVKDPYRGQVAVTLGG